MGTETPGDWIDPISGRPSCPNCRGFGYHEDGSEEGQDCETCRSAGVASEPDARSYLEATDAA